MAQTSRDRGASGGPLAGGGGQLLLFRSSGRWYERMIVGATDGPFVHVEIAISSFEMIGAHGNGIVKSLRPLITSPQMVTVDLLPYAESAERLADALQWARDEEGKHYGWTDIAFQAVKFLWPNNPFQLVMHEHWDCSDFATRVMQHAGVELPDGFDDPYANTPNDLGRIFGLVPPRNDQYAALLPIRPRQEVEIDDEQQQEGGAVPP